MMAERTFTRHGRRAHLYDPMQARFWPARPRTFCGHDAYQLEERSWFWRRRLAHASMCFECVVPEVAR